MKLLLMIGATASAEERRAVRVSERREAKTGSRGDPGTRTGDSTSIKGAGERDRSDAQVIFLADENPAFGNRSPETLGGTGSCLYLYVKDADAVFRKAVGAGAKMKGPVEDMFWGDRCGAVTDPFGHEWSIATRKEEVPPEELKRRGEEFFKQMGGKPS